jgi:hypothetical protein
MPAAKKTGSGIVRVKDSFSAQDDKGNIYTYHKGDLLKGDEPVLKVKGWEGLFEPVEDQFRAPEVEQATAAPGEKRGASSKDEDEGA